MQTAADPDEASGGLMNSAITAQSPQSREPQLTQDLAAEFNSAISGAQKNEGGGGTFCSRIFASLSGPSF